MKVLWMEKKNNKRHLPSQGWVFCGVERRDGNKFLIPLIDADGQSHRRDAETLIPVCCKYIKPGTTVISDKWIAYSSLNKHRFTHLAVNLAENFVTKHWCAHAKYGERPHGGLQGVAAAPRYAWTVFVTV